uniref:Uncharacterized protein n=1 Tax=viral metagenome TaxID=1070528 RepID=A0A6C0J5W2_9ZZZZ
MNNSENIRKIIINNNKNDIFLIKKNLIALSRLMIFYMIKLLYQKKKYQVLIIFYKIYQY